MSERITKKQLKGDSFITTMLTAWEYVKAHQQRVFIVLAAVVAAAVIVGWASYARKQAEMRASSQFAEALMSLRQGDMRTGEELFKLVADKYGSVREGAYARYFVGWIALEEGRDNEAIESFDAYLKKAGSHPYFHDAAMEGKAIALENEHKYSEAAAVYADLLGSIKTNGFMETEYMTRAAENYRLANQSQKAIEILEKLLDRVKGIERSEVEIKLAILRG